MIEMLDDQHFALLSYRRFPAELFKSLLRLRSQIVLAKLFQDLQELVLGPLIKGWRGAGVQTTR